MKAARVHALGEAPRIDEIEAPVATPGRTIVEMQAATVGHIDRTVWSGNFFQHPPLPYIPGLEAAGIVRASERFAVGERVWLRGAGLGIRQDGTWCEVHRCAGCRRRQAAGLGVHAARVGVLLALHLGLGGAARCGAAAARRTIAGHRRQWAVGGITVQLALALGARVYGVVRDAAQASDCPPVRG